MMKKIGLALVLAFGAMTAPALAQAPAATQAAALSVDSTMGELKANPAALAILQAEVPQIASSSQVPDSLTLRALAQFAPQLLTEEKLNSINAQLAALPR